MEKSYLGYNERVVRMLHTTQSNTIATSVMCHTALEMWVVPNELCHK